MKLKTKKIIAREFLILILVFILGLVFFECVYPYNKLKWHQVEGISATISEKTKIRDSLSNSYKIKMGKRDWFYEKFNTHYDLSTDKTFDERDEIWNRFDNWVMTGKINFFWNFKWGEENLNFLKSIGFSDPESIESFVETNRITQIDSINYKNALAINPEIKLLLNKKNEIESKILSYNEQIEFGINAVYMNFIILFGVRYLFLSIKWSIHTLKQKQDE